MIIVSENGVEIEIKGIFKARELWDLRQAVSNAISDYYTLVGKDKFREEMGYNPEKAKNIVGG